MQRIADGTWQAMRDALGGYNTDPSQRQPAWYSLSGLVADICDRAGMPPETYDVMGLQAEVDGFIITNQHAAFTYIRSLAEVFFFDPVNVDGKLSFVHRGGNIVREIDPDDVLDEVDEDEEHQRRDNLTIPRVLNFSYFDLSGGIQPDLQKSDRDADTRSVGELSVDTAVVMRTDDAKRVAVMSHKVSVEDQRGEYHIALPDSYLALSGSDVVSYRGSRLRIFEVEVDDGFQRYKMAHDRGAAYYSQAIGEEPPLPPPPTSIVPGPTHLHLIDTHILQTGDDQLGYYVAVSGEAPAWRGARVEFSDDGGENYLDSRLVGDDTLMGELLEPLGTHPQAFPDVHNTLVVRVVTPYAELHDVTLRDQLNRKNLVIVGDELISFGTAEEVEEGVWHLGHLLRGRKGTTPAEHAAGERFVVMERQQMAMIPAELYELGQPLTYRATSRGTDLQTVVTMNFAGNSQREREVAYLRGVRRGTQVELHWQGIGRLGGRTAVLHGDYFRGYRVVIAGQTLDTDQETLTVETGAAGPHTATVYQRNRFTGLGPATEITL